MRVERSEEGMQAFTIIFIEKKKKKQVSGAGIDSEAL